MLTGPCDNLSVAIVCKNNERTIGRTLDSVRDLAGEIVAVDSGSTDGTIGLLESHGARIVRSEWLGHVRTKQLALDTCTNQWVLCLDSDESPDTLLAAEIRRVVAGHDGPGAYRMNRQVEYRGRLLRHVWQPEPRVRLARRDRVRWGGLDPHDKLEPVDANADLGTVRGTLVHDSFESFSEHLRTQWGHSRTMAASLHANGARGSYASLLVSPGTAFIKQLVVKRGFLDGHAGWLAAASSAAGALMKHAMLIELSRED